MDRGILTDTNGREANFRNVILVMTTNAGAAQASRRTIGFTTQDHSTDAMEVIRKGFSPEFRNRLDAIVQFQAPGFEIGRASCRERGCQYVWNSGVAVD